MSHDFDSTRATNSEVVVEKDFVDVFLASETKALPHKPAEGITTT